MGRERQKRMLNEDGMGRMGNQVKMVRERQGKKLDEEGLGKIGKEVR